MNLRIVKNVVLLSLTSLLIAACGTGTTGTPQARPDPDALTPPAALVVGQATELQQVPATLDRATATLAGLLDPANPDFDPDLAAVFGALGGTQGVNAEALTTFSPLGLGRDLTRTLARRGAGTSRPLAVTVEPETRQDALPTGTWTIDGSGSVIYSPEPSTGYAEINRIRGTSLNVDWRVGGAETVWVEYVQGGTSRVRQEVPTRASATFTKGDRTLAAAQLRLTPGACLGTAGPDALSLSGWAGRESNSPAALGLQYAWTDTGIMLKANASYRTQTRRADAALDLDLRGTTAHRCDPARLAFTPTRADLSARVQVPGDEVRAALNLRKLSNLVISGVELGAVSPFARVTGDLSASVQHNAQPMLTAFGPLADGADPDLLPGDQVTVRYVQGGKLVEVKLPDMLK